MDQWNPFSDSQGEGNRPLPAFLINCHVSLRHTTIDLIPLAIMSFPLNEAPVEGGSAPDHQTGCFAALRRFLHFGPRRGQECTTCQKPAHDNPLMPVRQSVDPPDGEGDGEAPLVP